MHCKAFHRMELFKNLQQLVQPAVCQVLIQKGGLRRSLIGMAIWRESLIYMLFANVLALGLHYQGQLVSIASISLC